MNGHKVVAACSLPYDSIAVVCDDGAIYVWRNANGKAAPGAWEEQPAVPDTARAMEQRNAKAKDGKTEG